MEAAAFARSQHGRRAIRGVLVRDRLILNPADPRVFDG